MQAHGGSLDVTSELGSGTTFSVYLPAGAEAPAGEIAGPGGGPIEGRGEKVLLVDDEVAILGITCEMLTAFGYRVTTAASGAEAVRIFRQEKPDLTLLDLMMGDGNGRSALHEIRTIDPEARVIVVSGLSREEIAASAPDADECLSKPFSVQELLSTVARTLQPRAMASGAHQPGEG